MYRSNIPGTIAARLAGVPVRLGQIHNVDGWDNGRQVMLDRAVARLRSGTIAVSRAVQQDVMARLGQPEERVPILYNGVDTDRFQPRPTVGDGIRRDLGVLDSQVLFLVPARLHPQKNPLGVLDAFHRLGAGDRARLVFAGGGKLEAQRRAKVAELRMENQVTILGNRDDMDALYQAADVVVLSSFREGFSNAVVEALACGKPVVGSDVGGNREAVDRPEVGWIHPPGEPEALLRDLEEALAAGRDGLARRAAACRRRGEDFSLDAMVEQTHRLYARLLQREPQ
jgi:glycosyltransferase involved in cell wall biosynthesis